MRAFAKKSSGMEENMDNFQEYLTIMIESLEKKQDILSKIIRQNNFQYQAVTKEKFDEELFTKIGRAHV